MKKLSFYLLLLSTMYSCSDDQNIIKKEQLTLGIWFYEYEPDPISFAKSTTLTFNSDSTYMRDFVFYAPLSASGIDTTTTNGTWRFEDNYIIDLTGFGTCVQPVGQPPCVPSDIDFIIIQLTEELLEIKELINGNSASNSKKTRYVNIKS